LQTPSKRMMMGCVAMVGGLAVARVLVDSVAAFVHANGDPWVMPLLTRRCMVLLARSRLRALAPSDEATVRKDTGIRR